MNTKFVSTALALLALSTLSSPLSTAFAQGTAFTYQGRLNDGGPPANGTYDLRFSLFTTNSGGSLAYGFVTNSGIAISNGLFTVTMDFGSNVFDGTIYWLQIGVRTNGAAGFTAISPRQQLMPAPYSIFAENENAGGISGTIPAGNVGGTYGNAVNFNNGANSFDGSFFGDFYGATFTGGNFVGNFVGTGSSLTDVWHTGGNFGTIAGADFVGTIDNQPLELHVNSSRAFRLEPTANTGYVSGAVNVIGGSSSNAVMPGIHGATIAGGGAPFYFGGNTENLIGADFGTIGGGVNNEILSNSYESTISGGNANSIQPGAFRSTIGGGWLNNIQADAPQSFIGGGVFNRIFGDAVTNGDSVIAGGYASSILTNAGFSVIGGGLFNTIYGDTNDFGTGVIAGGDANIINSNSWNSFIGGGQGNTIGSSSDHSTIGGGQNNNVQASSPYAFVGGGFANSIQTNNLGSTITGGYGNQIQYSALPLGEITASTVGGGNANVIGTNALTSTIAGGLFNLIGNGVEVATISGGGYNTNNAYFGVIPGGNGNYAAGFCSFAAGYHAQALYQGDFVWADSQNTNFAATTTDQVSFRCQGGVRFTSGSAAANQTVAWTPGTGSWSFTSDRNAKENFGPVDVLAILEKVARLPLTEWNYKGYADRHIGPMAQDFHAAFPFNPNDKMLRGADEAGVELAAIQGLNQKLEEKDAEIADLKTRLEKLEQVILKEKSN